MKSTVVLTLLLMGCSSTTKGEGPSGSSTSGGTSSSSGTTTGSTSSSGTDISNAQCQSNCVTKLYQCGASSTDVPAACQQICNGSYSQSQLTCLQSAPCSELATANNLEDVCPP